MPPPSPSLALPRPAEPCSCWAWISRRLQQQHQRRIRGSSHSHLIPFLIICRRPPSHFPHPVGQPVITFPPSPCPPPPCAPLPFRLSDWHSLFPRPTISFFLAIASFRPVCRAPQPPIVRRRRCTTVSCAAGRQAHINSHRCQPCQPSVFSAIAIPPTSHHDLVHTINLDACSLRAKKAIVRDIEFDRSFRTRSLPSLTPSSRVWTYDVPRTYYQVHQRTGIPKSVASSHCA